MEDDDVEAKAARNPDLFASDPKAIRKTRKLFSYDWAAGFGAPFVATNAGSLDAVLSQVTLRGIRKAFTLHSRRQDRLADFKLLHLRIQINIGHGDTVVDLGSGDGCVFQPLNRLESQCATSPLRPPTKSVSFFHNPQFHAYLHSFRVQRA